MEILFLFVMQPVTNWIDFVFMFSASGVEEFHFTSLKCVLASKIDFGAPRQIECFGWQMIYFVPSLGENWNFFLSHMLSIHSKGSKNSCSSATSNHLSMTQHDLQDLQSNILNLQELMDDKEKSTPKPAVSLTQVGIQDLQEKIHGLQDLLRRDLKSPALSENQLAIRALQAKVKKLMCDLEHKDLYCDSLENYFFEDRRRSPNRNFEELSYCKRQLERENRELMEYIARDKNRGSRRKYNRY
jgi:hypothetical protein